MSGTSRLIEVMSAATDEIRAAGLYKSERVITSPQGAHVQVGGARDVLNLCANNYLGLADHPSVIEAAQRALGTWGFGLASVRFICGTQSLHQTLEKRLSEFLGTEETILYSSCFDANGGLFETILTAEDAVISDQLNHASIIDGVRLCKAQRFRYRNSDMADLETQLKAAAGARLRLIATDGVFSMDGSVANLPSICELADRYEASVMIDDCHGVGVLGEHGRGTHQYHGCLGRIDIITGTLGKALGGASGGYTSGRREVIGLLRQKSRPYLFSNTIAPPIAAGSIAAIDLLTESRELLDRLSRNAALFRDLLSRQGFELIPGSHAIIPIMLFDARVAAEMSQRLLEKGIYVVGFSYPVVPQGQARIRTQMSAAHTEDDLRWAAERFAEVKHEMGRGAT